MKRRNQWTLIGLACLALFIGGVLFNFYQIKHAYGKHGKNK